MPSALPFSFFDRPVLAVAEDLLGKVLVRKRIGEGSVQGIITEVEAYDGPKDRASHAHRGRTARNAPMFGPAGRWYIYLVYGMHWMLNIVTGPEGYPAAVLIRGVGEIPVKEAQNSLSRGERARVRGYPQRQIVGPGKVTRAFDIDKTFNTQPAQEPTGLWIEDGGIVVPRSLIRRTPRIGVDYAGTIWAKKPYRFLVGAAGNPHPNPLPSNGEGRKLSPAPASGRR